MTMQMILALGVLIFMIVLIMTDALPFGAPPLLASLLIVVFQLYPQDADPIAYAFSGFVNSNVWMIAFFMVVLAGFQKTRLTGKIRSSMLGLVEKGGLKSYVLLLLLVMLGCTLTGGGSTGYYVLILSLVATIPYNEQLPTSKLLMPLGFAANHPLIPLNVAIFYGLTATMLDSAGISMNGTSTIPFMVMSAVASVAFLIWSIAGFKLLPGHPIAEAEKDSAASAESEGLPAWKEAVTIISLLVSVVGMMFIDSFGAIAYILPGLCAFILLAIKVIDWKEFRENLFSPVILMMTCVIPVANALADSGFTAMVGNAVAGAVSGLPLFFIILIFAFLCSACATLTGASFGSAFVFVPIVIATCQAMGVDPVGAAAATVMAAWSGGFLPIDGLPAMIMGMGKYSMSEYWKFTIPMYIIGIFALALGAVLAF